MPLIAAMNSLIAGPIGAAFLPGRIVGGAANLILSGGLSQLGGMFGGASTPQQEFGV